MTLIVRSADIPRDAAFDRVSPSVGSNLKRQLLHTFAILPRLVRGGTTSNRDSDNELSGWCGSSTAGGVSLTTIPACRGDRPGGRDATTGSGHWTPISTVASCRMGAN
jgi:hypothetical protein